MTIRIYFLFPMWRQTTFIITQKHPDASQHTEDYFKKPPKTIRFVWLFLGWYRITQENQNYPQCIKCSLEMMARVSGGHRTMEELVGLISGLKTTSAIAKTPHPHPL